MGRDSHQVLQDLVCAVERPGPWRPHALLIGEVGDGEVEGERHQGWFSGCSRGGRRDTILSQASLGHEEQARSGATVMR